MLFQCHLGWQTKAALSTVRFRPFTLPFISAHPAGKTTVILAPSRSITTA